MSLTVYYIPEIEDMVLGQRYEELIDGKWEKKVFTVKDSVQGLIDRGLWRDDKIRAQYLSHDDIVNIKSPNDNDRSLFKLDKVDNDLYYYSTKDSKEEDNENEQKIVFTLKYDMSKHRLTLVEKCSGNVLIFVNSLNCKCLNRLLSYLKDVRIL